MAAALAIRPIVDTSTPTPEPEPEPEYVPLDAEIRAWLDCHTADEYGAYHANIQRGNGHEPRVWLPYLRAYRNLIGWTQQELAARAGVTSDTIRRLEHLRTPARYGLLGHLADAFGLSNATLASRRPLVDDELLPTTLISLCEEPGALLRFWLHRLAWYARVRRLSYAALAERTLIPESTIEAIAALEQPATLEQVSVLAAALDMRQADLLNAAF